MDQYLFLFKSSHHMYQSFYTWVQEITNDAINSLQWMLTPKLVFSDLLALVWKEEHFLQLSLLGTELANKGQLGPQQCKIFPCCTDEPRLCWVQCNMDSTAITYSLCSCCKLIRSSKGIVKRDLRTFTMQSISKVSLHICGYSVLESFL